MAKDPYPQYKYEKYTLFRGINAKMSQYANDEMEFRDISNMNFFNPGALTKRPGSTMYVGSTLSGSVVSGTEFTRIATSATYLLIKANTNLYSVTPPGTQNPVVTGLLSGAIMSFVTFVDRLFCADGNDFFKFDGSGNFAYGLPPGATAQWAVTLGLGGSLTPGTTQTFVCAYGYVNERGFLGPLSNGITIVVPGSTLSGGGGSIFNAITYYGMTNAFSSSYPGITAIQLWRTLAGGVNFFQTTLLINGGTQAIDTGFPLGSTLATPKLWFTMIPRFQAIYNNQYFMAGFSQMPSRVYWSEIGEPEAVEPSFYFDVKPNDGDRITALKPYNGIQLIGKINSIHQLGGDNPNNFNLAEISSEYGILSHQACVTFDNVCWALDRKGVLEFNGAQIRIISTPVEPTFLNMNVSSAIDQACAVHFKRYNEVWFAIPTNGATINNTIVVYDYVTQAWTHYDGLNAACLFAAQGAASFRTVFLGGYTGSLSYFSASFMGDNGSGITCSAFCKWLAPFGQTTENLYRRFWMDVNPVLGITGTVNLQFFSNYATLLKATGVIYQTAFQSRLDFGISARSIAVQWGHYSASLPFQVNSYAFESRYQRSV